MWDRLATWVAVAMVLGAVCGQMVQFRSQRMSAHGEIVGVVAGVQQARDAIAEGQFPPRVAPRECDGNRYPLFQFYGQFQYAAGGLVARVTGCGPYVALKALLLGVLLAGGAYTLRLGQRLTADPPAAALGAVVFTLSPYMFTDLRARGAVAEMCAFNLLPVALFYTLRCLAPGGRWPDAVKVAVAWAMVGLAHNITFLYGVTLVGLLVLTHLPDRRTWPGFGRLVLAGGVTTALLAWYVAPQLAVYEQLHIGEDPTGTPTAAWARDLVTWQGLLHPWLFTAVGSTTPRLALQIGWPILAGALGAVAALVTGRLSRPLGWDVLRFNALFAIALTVALARVDVWQWLPQPYAFIQYPYRAMVFVVLTGSLLVAIAFAAWAPGAGRQQTGQPRVGRPRGSAVGIALLFVVLPALTYVQASPRMSRQAEAEWLERGTVNVNDRYDYVVRPSGPLATTHEADALTPADVKKNWTTGPWCRWLGELDRPSRVVLPFLYYPAGLVEVWHNGTRVEPGHVGPLVAVDLPSGRHDVRVAFVGLRWANRLSAAAWAGVLLLGIVTGARSSVQARRGIHAAHAV